MRKIEKERITVHMEQVSVRGWPGITLGTADYIFRPVSTGYKMFAFRSVAVQLKRCFSIRLWKGLK